ncbi:unnamed protein product, partial [Mesorhabditis spiculigera]
MAELAAYREQLDEITRQQAADPGAGLEEEANDLRELIALLEAEAQDEAGEGPSTAPEPQQDEEFTAYLEALLGQRCMAPFSGASLRIPQHAAIIFEFDSSVPAGEDFNVRILYSHPMIQAMSPCKAFLQNRCKFGEKCRFSHGESIPFSQLEDYEEPEFESLQPGSLVLAKIDDLWEAARVVDLDKESEMAVRLLQSQRETRVSFAESVPLPYTEVQQTKEEAIEVPSSVLDSVDHFSELKGLKHGNVTVGELGNWQGGGFGLKLMQKMGYKLGQGLGKQSDGIVHAIQATIMPKKKSVDYVFRNKDKNRVVDGKKAHERIGKQLQLSTGIEADIFEFLNRRFDAGPQLSAEEAIRKERKQLSEASESSLLSNILDAERKLKDLKSKKVKLEQGIFRNRTDKATVGRLQASLDQVIRDISSAEGSHQRVQGERDSRQRKKDLF